MSCSLLVASPWSACDGGEDWIFGCIVAPVVAEVGVPRWRGVYGIYFVEGIPAVDVVSTDELDTDEVDEGDVPGSVGDRRGCAVNDSCEPVRSRAP